VIVRDWSWVTDDMELEGYCAEVSVERPQAARVSNLLGPDGEPLMIGYDRPKLGFDLTPTK